MYVEEGVTYISSDKYNISFQLDTLLPAIPYVSVNVLVGQNERFGGFNYICNVTDSVNSVFLPPNPIVFSTKAPLTSSMVDSVAYSQVVCPDTLVKYVGSKSICGYKILSFSLSPFIYNTQHHVLYLNEILLSIQIDQQGAQPIYVNPHQKPFVESVVVNGEEMDSLYHNLPPPTSNPQDCYRYLVITADSLASAFQPLVQWKTIKGVRAKVLTLEEIYSNPQYSARNNQLKIKKALRDYYGRGLEYVLLGGSSSIVPTIMCRVRLENKAEIHFDKTPADCFYGSFSTMDWDEDMNDSCGELSDNILFGNDIAVTRVPVFNTAQIQAFVDRVIEYEKGTDYLTREDKILMAGAKVHHFLTSGKSDAQNMGEKLYNYTIAPNWSGSMFRLFDTMTDYPEGASYSYSGLTLQRELEKGYPFVSVISHGKWFEWVTEHAPFTTTHAQNLINRGKTIIITPACHTNAFDLDDAHMCLSQSFFHNTNSGILAYIGSSVKAWGDEYDETGIYKFVEHLYEKLFKNYNYYMCALGNLVKNVKDEMFTNLNTYDQYDLWHYLAINTLGDPEMVIYHNTRNMKEIKDSEVSVSIDNDYILSVGTLDSTYICVSSADDYGQQFYMVSNQIGGFVSGQHPASKCNVCVTKENYVPYLCSLFLTNVIQNETLTGKNRILNPYRIEIGRNIESHLQEGPVIIESGKTLVKNSQGVIIRNGFKVEKGASFVVCP